MAEIKSFPNNQNVYVGAEWVMKWLHGRTSGVFGADGNLATSVVAGSMAVQISDGVGWLANDNADGVVFWNDEESSNGEKLTLTVDTADGALDRIDRVIVTWETTNYVALPTISILKGTASSSPSVPALTNNSTQRQISLARIKIPAGTVSLTSAMITDERLDPSVCGIVTETIKIDTSTMQNQFEALLESIQQELAELEAGTAVELKKLVFESTVVQTTAFNETNSYEDFPHRAAVTLSGVTSGMIPEVVFLPDNVGLFAPIAESYNGGIYIYASEIPESAVTIPTIICWRGA